MLFILAVFGWTLTVAVCVLAWLRGGTAERWGSGLNLIGTVCAQAAYLLAPGSRDVALLIVDGVLAMGLLLLAVRYMSLWIGGAMLLQATQFILHTYYFVMELPHDRLFGVANDAVTFGILACILAGIVRAWLRRRTAAAASPA